MAPAATAAAERQTGLGAGAAVLASMVHDEDGDVVLALQGAEVAEQGGDLAGVVLVDAVEPDEGVEHEEAGCELADGGAEACLVAARAHVLGDRYDQRHAGLPSRVPLRVAVHMEHVVVAPGTPIGPVPAGIAQAAPVRVEIPHVLGDQRAALETGHPARNQATL
jgi:hypothetical protein